MSRSLGVMWSLCRFSEKYISDMYISSIVVHVDSFQWNYLICRFSGGLHQAYLVNFMAMLKYCRDVVERNWWTVLTTLGKYTVRNRYVWPWACQGNFRAIRSIYGFRKYIFKMLAFPQLFLNFSSSMLYEWSNPADLLILSIIPLFPKSHFLLRQAVRNANTRTLYTWRDFEHRAGNIK